MDTLITEKGLLLFFHWLAAQGIGVSLQFVGWFIVRNYKNEQKETLLSWRHPMKEQGDSVAQFWEFITEMTCVLAFVVYTWYLFTFNQFANNIGNLWGEYFLLMLFVGLFGIVSEIKPSWEKQINRHTTKGVVWIALLILFSLLTG